jgi:hypothetical protein
VFLFLWSGRRGKPRLIRYRNRRHSSLQLCTLHHDVLFDPPASAPTAPSTALWRQCATSPYSITSRIHSTATASSSLRGGIVGERSRVLCDGFDAEAWGEAQERNGRLTPESTWTGRTGRESCMRPFCWTRTSKYAPSLTSSSSRRLLLIDAEDPTPTPQQSDSQTSFPHELQREYATR